MFNQYLFKKVYLTLFLFWQGSVAVNAATTVLSLEEMQNTRGGLTIESFPLPASNSRSKQENIRMSFTFTEALNENSVVIQEFSGNQKLGIQTVATDANGFGTVRTRATNFPLRTSGGIRVNFQSPTTGEFFDAASNVPLPSNVGVDPRVEVLNVRFYNLQDDVSVTTLPVATMRQLIDNLAFNYNRRTTPSADAILSQCPTATTVQLRLDPNYDPNQPLVVPRGCTRPGTNACVGENFVNTFNLFSGIVNDNGGRNFMNIFVVNSINGNPNIIGQAPLGVNGLNTNFFFLVARPSAVEMAATLTHELGHTKSLRHPDNDPSTRFPNESATCTTGDSNLMCALLTTNRRLIGGQCDILRNFFNGANNIN